MTNAERITRPIAWEPEMTKPTSEDLDKIEAAINTLAALRPGTFFTEGFEWTDEPLLDGALGKVVDVCVYPMQPAHLLGALAAIERHADASIDHGVNSHPRDREKYAGELQAVADAATRLAKAFADKATTFR